MIESENEVKNQEVSEEINLGYFFNILANAKDANKYIKELKLFFNDYFSLNSGQYNRFNELYHKHFKKKIDSIINTPIYKIEYVLKSIVQIQLKFFKTMVSNAEIINLIQNKLSDLEKILEKLPSKINNFSFNGTICDGSSKISKSMGECLNELETKIVEEYIKTKYNKQILKLNNNNNKELSIDNLVSQIRYLEISLVNILKQRKNQYFDELKKYDNKTTKVFNDITIAFENFISYLKNAGNKFNEELINLENEIKSKNTNSGKNEESNDKKMILSKNDFDVKEQDIYRFKYKIKILKNKKIQLAQDSKENEGTNTKINEFKDFEVSNDIENQKKLKKEKYNINFMFLGEKDIYEIISKLYSYNFLVLDKSQYDLVEAKGKIEANELSNKLLDSNDQKENRENIFKNKKYEDIIKLVDEKILNSFKNIEAFFLQLNNYRGNGKNLFIPELYDIIIYIYNKALDYILINPQNNIADVMLILSQTYYKKVNTKKIYLVEDIKPHKLFKEIGFWEKLIHEKINEEFKIHKKLSSNSNILSIFQDKNKDEIIITKLFPFISMMKDFNITKEKIIELMIKIMEKYNCSDNTKKTVMDYINSATK